jgi:putative glutamine amidotransferase
MTSKHRRLICIAAASLFTLLTALGLVYRAWFPSPPAEAPRIGVSMTTHLARLVRGPAYESAIARAGGQAVALNPGDAIEDPESAIGAILDRVDALMLGGGDDVDPELYGGSRDNAARTNRRRDEFEIRLIREALKRDMPILGICRGIQILNVAHGGTLRSLRNDQALSECHGIDLVDSWTAHDITVEPDTRLAGVVGAGLHQVNSWHGQAVDQVGAGLRICATADDGVIESVERPDRAFVIGIQWHPEFTLNDESARAMFRALVEQADAYRRSRNP